MPPSSDWLRGSYDGRRPRLEVLRAAIVIALCAGFLLALFVGGEYVQRYFRYKAAREATTWREPTTVADPVRSMALNLLGEYHLPGHDEALLGSGLPVYDLRIDPDDLAHLQAVAEQVTAAYVSEGIEREYVPAGFRSGDEWIPIQLKLRGIFAMHYIKSRPSLRLKFPKDRLFDGKRQINLSDPYDKGLTTDVTTNWELERYGVLTWDSRFVVVRVNGDVVGLFQEIEQFGRSMSDRNRRPEGFIFSGHGQFFGSEGSGYEKAVQAMELVKQCHPSIDHDFPEHCDWELLQEYMDTDRWAWAAAMLTLLKSRHGWESDNLRLFWDPSYGQFEPIPWDYNVYTLDLETYPEGEDLAYYGVTFNRVSEFRRMRDTRLWTLLEERVDPMIEHANGLYEELENTLRYDSRHVGVEGDRERQALYVRTLDENRQKLKALFLKQDLRVRSWVEPAGRATVELANYGKAFVSVAALRFEVRGSSLEVPLDAPVIVDGLYAGEAGRRVVTVDAPPEALLVGVLARNEVTGAELAQSDASLGVGEGVAPQPEPAVAPTRPALALANVREEAERVTFGPGVVTLEGVVTIPRGRAVVFAPGLDLQMGEGASLLVYGDLSSVGTAEQPILVHGRGGAKWGAVAVQGTRVAPRRVELAYTRFTGGTGTENARTLFTGSFSVYGGEVEIRHSEFREGRAIDGINLKNCQVDLRENVFADSADDMVDCDFCKGHIAGSAIFDSGGDGLDFSGSDVRLDGNAVRGCADKGVSVGEQTVADIRDLLVESCNTGVGVKDLSQVTVTNAVFRDLQIGIALYVKKPTFGPSEATISGIEMENVATRVLKEHSCRLYE